MYEYGLLIKVSGFSVTSVLNRKPPGIVISRLVRHLTFGFGVGVFLLGWMCPRDPSQHTAHQESSEHDAS